MNAENIYYTQTERQFAICIWRTDIKTTWIKSVLYQEAEYELYMQKHL